MRLSWTKRYKGTSTARTSLGTAIVQERPDGQATLDLWRPDQSNIGTVFPNEDAAKLRAEAILDPRATAWELLDDPMLSEDDELLATGSD